MCLTHTLGRPEEEKFLITAVDRVLESGTRTADIAAPRMAPVSTAAMADAVLAALDAMAGAA